VLAPTMSTEPRHTGREEVERVPKDNCDLENGASGRGNSADDRNGSGENIKSAFVWGRRR
jgi:hypothetical protein